MRRALVIPATIVSFLLLAPAAMAHDGGEGWWGLTDDKVVTNAGFILIAFFPVFILVMSLLQWQLDKRKYARRAAAKGRETNEIWRGGW